MSIYKRGRVYWYKFMWNGEMVRESTKQGSDRVARCASRYCGLKSGVFDRSIGGDKMAAAIARIAILSGTER